MVKKVNDDEGHHNSTYKPSLQEKSSSMCTFIILKSIGGTHHTGSRGKHVVKAIFVSIFMNYIYINISSTEDLEDFQHHRNWLMDLKKVSID